MDTGQAVAKRICALCKERGMTTSEAAQRSGVPPKTVCNIVSGKSKNPGIITITKLCAGFGITLEQFFNVCEFDEQK